MKKFILIIAALFATCSLFAQNAKYKELLEKAKAYETKNEWAYALGFYADAISEDPSNAKDAYIRFTEILNEIEKGNPGIGAYKGLKLYNGWVSLLTNAEKYWTEYCPYVIEIEKPEIKTSNGKTADYWAKVNFYQSQKYIKIMKSICAGYEKVYQSSWDLPKALSEIHYDMSTDYIPHDTETWPGLSATKASNLVEHTKENQWHSKYNISNMDPKNWIKNNTATFTEIIRRNWVDFGYNKIINAYTFSYSTWRNNYSLYEFSMKLVKKDGTVLVKGQSFVPVFYKHNTFNYDNENNLNKATISGLTPAQAELIDNDEAYITVDKISLRYGPMSNAYLEDDKVTENSLKKLASINVALPKTLIITPYSNVKDMFNSYCKSFNIDEKVKELYTNSLKEFETDDGIEYIVESFNTNCSKDSLPAYDFYGTEKNVPLFLIADVINNLTGFKTSYDKYGNLINKDGFIVTTRETEDRNGRYAIAEIKRIVKLSKEEKQVLLAKAKTEAESVLVKRPVIEGLRSMAYNRIFNYETIIKAFNDIEEALETNKSTEINNAIKYLKNYLTEEKYEGYLKEYNTLTTLLTDAQKLYDEKNEELKLYREEFKGSSLFKDKLVEYSETLRDLSNFISKKYMSDLKKQFEKAKEIDFTAIKEKLDYCKKLIEDTQASYEEKTQYLSDIEKSLSYAYKAGYITSSEYNTFIKGNDYITFKNTLRYYKSALENKKYEDIEKYAATIPTLTLTQAEEKATAVNKIIEEEKNLRASLSEKMKTISSKAESFKQSIPDAADAGRVGYELYFTQIFMKSDSDLEKMKLDDLKKINQYLDSINFKILTELKTQYEAGKKAIADMGITLTKISDNGTVSIYQVDAEKKSAGAKAKAKGELHFIRLDINRNDKNKNPSGSSYFDYNDSAWRSKGFSQDSAFTHISLTDFYIEIGKNIGKAFTVNGTKSFTIIPQ